MFTQGSLMYTGTLCGKINSFSLQNQKVKKIGIQGEQLQCFGKTVRGSSYCLPGQKPT